MSVAERIRRFNAGRDPERLRLKYKAMHKDPFAFLRGTCHLFYEDWPARSPLNDAPLAWICGDLHLENFGTFKGDNGLEYFDLNDFDEAILAPCTWDITRLVTDKIVAADWDANEYRGMITDSVDGVLFTMLARKSSSKRLRQAINQLGSTTVVGAVLLDN